MSGIQGQNTKPEAMARQLLQRQMFRFRLDVASKADRLDIVFPRHRSVVFVHGCFWHDHDCHLFKWPSRRPDWWRPKIERTREFDGEAIAV